MADTQRNICCTCKFWNPWRVVVLADDEPKALGHCVIVHPIEYSDALIWTNDGPQQEASQRPPTIQGLTAEDFYCVQFQPAVEPVTEKVDG